MATQIAILEVDGVYLWDVASGTQTNRLAMDDTTPYYGALAYSPDGRYIAASGNSYDPTHFRLYVWDAKTGEQIGATSGSSETLLALAFSPASDWLAATAGSGTYRYSLDLQVKTQLDKPSDARASGLAFTPDGSILAIGRSADVALMDVATHAVITTIPLSVSNNPYAYAYVLSLAFNDGGSLLAISTQNNGISVWDMATETFTIPPEQGGINDSVASLVFKPDSDQFAYIYHETTIQIEDGRSGEIITQKGGWDGSSVGLSIGAASKTIATYGFDSMIRLYDTQTGAVTRRFDTGGAYIYNIKTSPDGRYLAYSSGNFTVGDTPAQLVGNGITLIDLQSDAAPIQFGGANDIRDTWIFASDSQIATFDPQSHRIIDWDVNAPDRSHALMANYIAGASKLTISTDGSRLALVDSSRSGNLVEVYDLTHDAHFEIDLQANQVVPIIRLSADGKLLAARFSDKEGVGTLAVWDLDTQTELYRRPLDLPVSANDFDFSPDGRLIAAIGYNALIVLDADNGETRFQTLAPNSASYTVAFAHDGRYLATSGHDGIIRLWGVP